MSSPRGYRAGNSATAASRDAVRQGLACSGEPQIVKRIRGLMQPKPRSGHDDERSALLVHREALAAAALPRHVGVAENEGRVQPVSREIDFGAVDERQALVVDDEPDAVLLDDTIVGGHAVGDLDEIGVPGTARLAHAEAHARRRRIGGQEVLHPLARGLGQLDGHDVDSTSSPHADAANPLSFAILKPPFEAHRSEFQGMSVVSVKQALSGSIAVDSEVTVRGWVRTRRDSKAGLSFVNVSDGSCFDPIQVVAPNSLPNYADQIVHLTA